ncbi:cupin-like domain-containing protein [Sorangium sp. So ce295]|uniref:cupin-like domain-containing protein n=1 Tax=Sorangium sp. So ce295 TaxID=3133295 RepID=UPI003F6133EF
MTEIERVGIIGVREFHARFVTPETPVILTRMIDDWPAARRWTPAYFQQRFGDVKLDVELLQKGRPGENSSYLESMVTQSMTIAEYIDLAGGRDDGSIYAAQQPLRTLLPDAARDIRPIPYLSRVLCRAAGTSELLWIGSRGCASGLHFDKAHNFNIQLYGRKRWVIFPREQQPLLYVPSTLQKSHFSPIDFERPDHERFPRYRDATPIEFEIGPGETLFLPVGWVHHVRTLEFSIGLNLWWLTWRQAARWAPGFLRGKLAAAWASATTPTLNEARNG